MKTSKDLRALAIRLGAPEHILPFGVKGHTAKQAWEAITHPSWLHWLAQKLAPTEQVAAAHAKAKVEGLLTCARELYAARYCQVFREMIPFELLSPPVRLPWFKRFWNWLLRRK